MTSKKVIELFYDVVSPYSWLGFEVSFSFKVGFSNRATVFRIKIMKLLYVGGLCLQVMCRYRQVWNIELKLRPAFLGGIMHGSGTESNRVHLLQYCNMQVQFYGAFSRANDVIFTPLFSYSADSYQ